MIGQATWYGTWRRLWGRAPLWRGAVLLAFAATALFVGLAPRAPDRREREPEGLQAAATYAPAPKAREGASQAQPPVTPSPITPEAARAAIPVAAGPSVGQPGGLQSSRRRQAVPQPPGDAPLALSSPSLRASGADLGKSPPAGGTVSMGKAFRDSFEVNGYRVPLPPGTWTVLSDIRGNRQDQSVTTYFLGRIEHQRLAGVVMIESAVAKVAPGTGFPSPRACQDGNAIYLVNEANEPNGSQSCWAIHNIFTPPWTHWDDRSVRIGPLERAAAGEMSVRGISYPQDFVAVEFYRAERARLLRGVYLFSPELDHIHASPAGNFAESDWYGPNIGRDTARVAYVGRLRDWGMNWWKRFKDAFASAG